MERFSFLGGEPSDSYHHHQHRIRQVEAAPPPPAPVRGGYKKIFDVELEREVWDDHWGIEVAGGWEQGEWISELIF